MKKTILLLVTTFVFVIGISQNQTDFVHASGRYLVHGPNNDTVFLRGINFNNFWLDDGTPNWIINDPNDNGAPQTYVFGDQNWFADAAQIGFNTVRVTLNYRIFEDNANPYVYKQSGWDFINQYIAWAQQYNIYLILDMHVAPGGLQNTPDAPQLWMNQSYQDRTVALWHEIASRYANDTTIASFDLLNEPTPVDSIAGWSNLAQRIADTIRMVDNNHLLTVEYAYGIIDTANTWYPFWDLSQQMFLINDANVMYDFHYYQEMTYALQCYNNPSCTPTIQYNDPSVVFPTESGNSLPYDQAWLADDLTDWLAIFQGANYPVNIGEWAPWRANYEFNNNQMQGYEYICDLMTLFEQNGLNWQYYCYSEFRNTTQDANGNDGLNTRLLNYMTYGSCSGPTGVSEIKKEELPLVYPNPFTNQIRIEIPENSIWKEINIIDITGKVIQSNIITNEMVNITVKPGIYFLNLLGENGETDVIKILRE